MTQIAQEMIRDSVKAPSRKFGSLLLELDNELLGKKATQFRLEHNVKAVEVAKVLKLTRAAICRLETGRKAWDKHSLQTYLAAVRQIARQQA